MPSSKLLIALLVFTGIFSLNTKGFSENIKGNGNPLKASLKEPQAVDPIAGILRLFDTRPLVALDEGGHHTAQTHAFFRALVQDPRFARKVNDIVVEFGTCKYQDVMDRYINGENVPVEQLQMVWRETTQIFVFDNPVYRQFFETIRNVNLKLPKNKKLRVLLGDPPINWSNVNGFNDWVKEAPRDLNAAEIIDREVLKKGRKALLLYGGAHVFRRDPFSNFEPTPKGRGPVVEEIERTHPNSTYSVWTNVNSDDIAVDEKRKALIPIPSLIMLKGTTLGARDFTSVLSEDSWTTRRTKFVNGKRVNITRDEWAKFKLEDNVDALLYLGPIRYLYKTPYFIDTFADEAYYRESVRRSKILNGLNLEDIEELRNKYLAEKKP